MSKTKASNTTVAVSKAQAREIKGALGRYVSISAFVRDAIHEKLDRIKQNGTRVPYPDPQSVAAPPASQAKEDPPT